MYPFARGTWNGCVNSRAVGNACGDDVAVTMRMIRTEPHKSSNSKILFVANRLGVKPQAVVVAMIINDRLSWGRNMQRESIHLSDELGGGTIVLNGRFTPYAKQFMPEVRRIFRLALGRELPEVKALVDASKAPAMEVARR